jgi:hypothetical protein
MPQFACETVPFGTLLEQGKAVQGEIETGVSVVTVAELQIDCTSAKLAPILQPANCPSH